MAAGANHEHKQVNCKDNEQNAMEAQHHNDPFRGTVGKGSVIRTIVKIHVGIDQTGNKLLEHDHDDAACQQNLKGAPTRRN